MLSDVPAQKLPTLQNSSCTAAFAVLLPHDGEHFRSPWLAHYTNWNGTRSNLALIFHVVSSKLWKAMLRLRTPPSRENASERAEQEIHCHSPVGTSLPSLRSPPFFRLMSVRSFSQNSRVCSLCLVDSKLSVVSFPDSSPAFVSFYHYVTAIRR